MKLSLKLAALIIAFGAFLLPFIKPQTANAAGCQLIVSTTEVVAHGSFNTTVQNGQFPGELYVINYYSAAVGQVYTDSFIMPASGSYTITENLDHLFGSSSPASYTGTFIVTAGTTTPDGMSKSEACLPPFITITVIAPPPPIITSFTAASTNIAYNTGTTLNWTSTNATTCTLNGASVATNGSQPTGNLTSTTTYTLVCTNVSGNAQSSVTVNVQPPPAPTCSPPNQSALTGQTVNFTASAGNGTYSWSASGGTPSSGAGSSFSTAYTTAGTKTVTVTSASQNASCTVNVTAPPPIINSLTADNTNIAWGASTTIRWTTSNTNLCTLNVSPPSTTTSVPLNGSQSTGNLTTTTTYTLNCQGPGGSAQKSVTVTVAAAIPCTYNFSPKTVNINDPVTVTIINGDSTHTFFAVISGGASGTAGPGSFPLTINLNAPGTAGSYLVAARDDITKNLCALPLGESNTLVVNAPITWHLNQPNVAGNQLSVLFSFTPASNGNVALIVDTSPAFTSFPRPFDSDAIANGTGQVTWNLPPPGTYYAELVYLGVKVSDNVVQFTVTTPPPSNWTLTLTSATGYLAVFNISPNAGGGSVLLIEELPFGDPNKEVLIPLGASTISWTGPTTGTPTTYHAHISYLSVQKSNSVAVTLPVNPPTTQWTLSIQSISGNDVTLSAQCPTKDCPGYGGEAVIIIKDLGTQNSFPAGGGSVKFPGLPNGSHQAVIVVFLTEESGVVNFSLPQKTNCGWLNFPGGAGTVSGPVNNCALASPTGVISAILPYVFGIAGFLSIIIIVISGIQFITSSGNPEAAAAARNRLVFALIGLAVIILAFAILQIVDKLFLGGSGVS